MGPVAIACNMGNNFIESRKNEARKLNFNHRFETINRHAKGRADNSCFAQGCIEASFFAVFFLQPLGCAKDAAFESGILAIDNDAWIPFHLLIQGFIECTNIIQ